MGLHDGCLRSGSVACQMEDGEVALHTDGPIPCLLAQFSVRVERVIVRVGAIP